MANLDAADKALKSFVAASNLGISEITDKTSEEIN